jgi:Flp pilus assembly protein TadB
MVQKTFRQMQKEEKGGGLWYVVWFILAMVGVGVLFWGVLFGFYIIFNQ